MSGALVAAEYAILTRHRFALTRHLIIHRGGTMHTLTPGQIDLIKDDDFWRWSRECGYLKDYKSRHPFICLMRRVEIINRIQAQPFY